MKVNNKKGTTLFTHIVGARPQFVKLASLHRALAPFSPQSIIHTGQHYDTEMSDFFFRDLEIPAPDHNLNIGSGNQGEQTGNMLISLEKLLLSGTPDLLIVYGDTNSTLAGALTAAKLHIPCVHIEAGLRSFNRSMPEEINRIVADHTADYLFAPTQTAMDNLYSEGLLHNAFKTGDIMVDSIRMVSRKAEHQSAILAELKLEPGSFNLLTLHRPYNVDSPEKLRTILTGLNKLSEPVLFPVHPRTLAIISGHPHLFSSLANIRFLKPLGYLDFVRLEQTTRRIITDSGGIQKEAYILKKPCITLRTETEWTETVEDGWNLLLPPEEPDFYQAIPDFTPPSAQTDVFGAEVGKTMAALISRIADKSLR